VSSASHRTPPGEAKLLINNALALVAVGTKRHQIGTDSFSIPESVRDEIAIAYTLGKPILLFLESGASAEGFMPHYGTYLKFDRATLSSAESVCALVASVRTLLSSVQNNTESQTHTSDTTAEIDRLRSENDALKKRIEAQASISVDAEMRFERDVYWRGSDGPFCTNCWDNRRKAIRMLKCGNPAFSECPTCHTAVEIYPELDV
jgi:hypothetical protein